MPRFYFAFLASSLLAATTSMMFVKLASANPSRICTREEVEASLATLDTLKDCIPNFSQAEEEIAQLRACSQVQIPDVLNLMGPIADSRLLKCVPDLEQVNSLTSNIGNKIAGALSSLSEAEIGNEGKYELTGISYNIAGKEIKIEGVVRARHVFGEIKEQIPVPVTRYRREKVPVPVTKYKDVPYQHPVTKYRKEQVPVPGFETRRIKECALPKPLGGCFQWIEKDVKVPVTRMEWRNIPYPSTETRYKKVPYPSVEMQWKEVPYPDVEMQWKTVQPPPLSATCNFTYLFNITTRESTPTLSCGQGGLGNLTLNASAVARVLNGEVPSVGSIVSSIGMTPPGVVEKLDDTYDRMRAKNTQGGSFAGSDE